MITLHHTDETRAQLALMRQAVDTLRARAAAQSRVVEIQTLESGLRYDSRWEQRQSEARAAAHRAARDLHTAERVLAFYESLFVASESETRHVGQ